MCQLEKFVRVRRQRTLLRRLATDGRRGQKAEDRLLNSDGGMRKAEGKALLLVIGFEIDLDFCIFEIFNGFPEHFDCRPRGTQ